MERLVELEAVPGQATPAVVVTTEVAGVQVTSVRTAGGTVTTVGGESGAPWWMSQDVNPHSMRAEHTRVAEALRAAAGDGVLDRAAAASAADAASLRREPLLDAWRPLPDRTGPRMDPDRLRALVNGPALRP